MRKYEGDADKIFFLRNSCSDCILKPDRYFTIQDIWHTFGGDWEIHNSDTLPVLDLVILEKLAIAIALKKSDFNQRIAGSYLGVTQRVMTWFMKKYKITSRKYRVHCPDGDEQSTEDLFNQGINLLEWAKGKIVLCETESETEN